MAKKITIEEYEKQEKLKKKQNRPENRNKLLLPLEIIIVFMGISLIANVLLARNYYNIKLALEKEKSKPEPISGDIYTGEDLEKDMKLEFYDDNIVFVIDGFGDYYYTYDCMMKKVGDNQYSYLAFNKEAAINEGYREGYC